MKLTAIYSNDPDRFPRIRFNDDLSVIFARVRDASHQADSHNLGKTFLIRVIDFTLLGDVDKTHPFRVHSELFSEFVFYLEVETPEGQFVTIRRAVAGRRAIFIDLADTADRDCAVQSDADWAYQELGQDKAKHVLNEILNLNAIAPFTFRKGLGYFLRRQSDYGNEFMISRFGRGKDRDWKPFMALLLGFDHELVGRKYELDHREEETMILLRDLERRGTHESKEYDELKGMVELKTTEVEELRQRVNTFDFYEVESEITRETVSAVEATIADLNEKRYELSQEEIEIERALATEFGFDLDAIRSTFDEVGATLPDKLIHQYEDLIEFNRKISGGRKERLGTRLEQVFAEQDEIRQQLDALNRQRTEALEVITQRETLQKFRSLQQKLLQEEELLVSLRTNLAVLDQADIQRRQLRRIEEKRIQLVEQIEAMVRSGSDRYTHIRKLFARLSRAILFTPAVLSISVNSVGNLEFKTSVLERETSKKETDEGEGASYKKVLCACFDLALLIAHHNDNFYRFVYHDGIFEGLDNRRKASLLSTVRKICHHYGLQYILTVIDSDLPRDQEDNKVLFDNDEIVRELHDEGDSGRLFRMPSF